MSMSVTKTLVLGATAGAIALMGALAPASAKGKHHHHRHFHGLYAPFVVGSGHIDCNHYYWKWKHTGSRFWRSKYVACIS